MANPILFKDNPIAPVSLNTVNHADVSLAELRHVQVQFDPLTAAAGARLYFRVDEAAAAGGATIALLAPEGYLTAGGVFEVWVDPDATETPYLHVLLTDSTGAPLVGGANDRVYLIAHRASPD